MLDLEQYLLNYIFFVKVKKLKGKTLSRSMIGHSHAHNEPRVDLTSAACILATSV